MDDLQITISLTELMILVESANRVPEVEKDLASLSRRLDSLYAIYSQVLLRLMSIERELDDL